MNTEKSVQNAVRGYGRRESKVAMLQCRHHLLASKCKDEIRVSVFKGTVWRGFVLNFESGECTASPRSGTSARRKAGCLSRTRRAPWGRSFD